MSSEARRKGFFGVDRYANQAFGRDGPYFPSMASSQAHFASENFRFAVIPDSDAKIFDVEGERAPEVQLVRDALFGFHRRELWSSPNIAMEFQQLVMIMTEYRESFTAIGFDRAGEDQPWQLSDFSFLHPLTVKKRRRGGRTFYEQLVTDRDVYWEEEDESGDLWFEFEIGEVLHLEWPMDFPPGPKSPSLWATSQGADIDRRSMDSLRVGESGAYPEETFLPVARARAGAFRNALEQQKIGDAKVADALFGVPTDPVTEYFLADRLVRARAAASRVRSYLIAQFNAQVLDEWRAKNGWAPLRLVFRPQMFDASDWEEFGRAYKAGEASMDDLNTALALELDEGRSFGRLANP